MKDFLIGLIFLLFFLFFSYGFGYLIIQLDFLPNKVNSFGYMILIGIMFSLIFFGFIVICYCIGKLINLEFENGIFNKNKNISTSLEYRELKRRNNI